MSDPIYIVDQAARRPQRVDPVSFTQIGVRERADLEQWVLNHSDILGESLLIITPEYSRFDKTGRRLDVLALDAEGALVVVELKLDVGGSRADQQAIRYAAFCSTMTMKQAVALYAEYHQTTEPEAESRVMTFLGVDELPELGDRPRIILAAGSMEDQELTACVLWLRRFGVDITCIELAPYRLPEDGRIVLVPRTIIPLPETKDYSINVEQKEAARAQQQRANARYHALWKRIVEVFNTISPDLQATGRAKGSYMKLRTGNAAVHYEWMLKRREKNLDVAIHFEAPDPALNAQMVQAFEAKRAQIEEGTGLSFKIDDFGKRWKQARFSLPFTGSEPVDELAPRAARLMATLVTRTRPMVDDFKHLARG
jgi:hypothetical protein